MHIEGLTRSEPTAGMPSAPIRDIERSSLSLRERVDMAESRQWAQREPMGMSIREWVTSWTTPVGAPSYKSAIQDALEELNEDPSLQGLKTLYFRDPEGTTLT